MKLDAERWKVIDAILDQLLELPEDQRLDALRRQCEGDTTLIEDIAKLLADCETDTGPLDRNALQLAQTLMDQLAPDPARAESAHLKNLRIGAYTLEEEIGRGGMGVVYRAQRTQGDYAHTVAIKVLTQVNVTVVERFRREQQALATLKHPNITQLLDAGVTDRGLPYLIMELIEGETITDYCAKRALPLQARLKILDQVLEALAFSHKNLIVHRDIKPSNILVTTDGQVKLLDFSIAKLLDAGWALEETATHLHLLTPSYSAPEQILNQPITVATDIYQLGLLYYRVLTGHRPLTREAGSLRELVQAVCQDEVTRPSQAVSRPTGMEETLANPQEIRRGLSGDLDAIVLKMLRKEPAARYASIEALKADLYAYRHYLPVAARRAALGYQTGKYLRRNWRTITLTGAACAALFGYAVSMQLQNQRVTEALAKAELEQRKAQQVSQFLAQTFEAADPNKGGLKGITAADLLEEARTKINEELKDSPEIQAPLLNIFSMIYFRQQEYQKAEEILSNLLENPKTERSLDKILLAESKLRLAQQKIGLGEYTEAEALLRQSLEMQTRSQNPKVSGNPLYGETLTFLGHILSTQKRYQEATQVTQAAIDYLSNLGAAGDRLRSFALNILANIQFLYTDLNAAIDNMREALEIKRRVLGEGHSETSNTQLALARMLLDKDAIDEAQMLTQSAYSNIKNTLPATHPYHKTASSVLAKIAQKKGQFDEALKLLPSVGANRGRENVSTSQIFADFFAIDIFLEQGLTERSQKLLEQLSEIIPPTASDKTLVARLSLFKGRQQMLLNQPSHAIFHLEKALEILDPEQIEATIVARDLVAAKILANKNEELLIELDRLLNKLNQRYPANHSQLSIVCAMINRIHRDHQTNLVAAHPCAESKSINSATIPKYLGASI
jgi:serine/threonine protein kinase